jgi:hypothetical protein
MVYLVVDIDPQLLPGIDDSPHMVANAVSGVSNILYFLGIEQSPALQTQ